MSLLPSPVPVALLAAALMLSSQAKPCRPSSAFAADSVLRSASVALDLPGTRRVAMDPSGSCVQIEVSTPGTGRLAALILRGLDVPRDAVRFQVVS